MFPGDPSELVAAMLHEPDTLRAGDHFGSAIVPASTFNLPGDSRARDEYGRWSNPTWRDTEAALAALEAADVVAFPSGMAAIAATMHALLKAGDRILLPSDGYSATRQLARRFLEPLGVRVETCATPAMARADLRGLRVVWIETPSNPSLDVCSIADVVARAAAAGASIVVDNSMCGPLGQRPLELGADVLVCSDTKVVNGHSDLLFGHVACRQAPVLDAIREWRKTYGAIPGVWEAWLARRGLQTLELRFDRMCGTAQVLAERLSAAPELKSVRYPGLPADPSHTIASRQMLRYGYLLGLDFGTRAAAEAFIEHCRLVRAATSFGGIHSSAERRARWGDEVSDGYVRFSVGCEPEGALLHDIDTALNAVGSRADR